MKHNISNTLAPVSDTCVPSGWMCYSLRDGEEIQQLSGSCSAYTRLGYYSVVGGHYTNPSMALLSKNLESRLGI